uniref:T26-7p n=1 Tax=Thermococcus sp. 26/2 TaxID=758583 RepID=D6MY30_9EURY|nr:t26-7p [Thermococcus sp. 26/2]
MEKKDIGMKLAKWGLSSGLMGLLLYYAGQHAVTVQQTTETMAKVSFAFVLFIELLDKFADMGKLYGKFSKDRNSIIGGLIFGGLGFAIVLWTLTGTLKLSGASTPAAVVVAGFTALYIFAPDTGRDEWYFMAWLAANIATKFQYFQLLPAGFTIPGVSMMLSWLL